MTIRRRIFAFVAVLCTAVAVLASGSLVGMHASRNAMRATEEANTRYRLAMRFAGAANQYAEQAAELLLLGEDVDSSFEGVRGDLETAFAEMQRHSRQSEPTHHIDSEWTAEVDHLRYLFSKIDHAVERAMLLNGEGAHQEAVAIFRDEIQGRLDSDFRAVIARTVQEEEARVHAAEAKALETARHVVEAVVVASLLLILILAIAGANFARSLLEPIDALTRGARAIEEGSLAHRIGLTRPDELGRLSQHFDRMAERLQQKVEQLANAREGLEQQVAARTMELDRLNRELTYLDRQRVRFLADISHEMRTPLTVLRGEAEVTLRGPERPAAVYREALERIVVETADMSRLIDDLLFLARSEMGEIRFDEQHVTLSEVVLGAIEAATVLARQNHVAIALDDSHAELLVNADPRRLRQVLLIVLDNAVKYSDPGSIISVTMTDLEDGRGRVSIADQGHGIPSKDLPYVFDRFYRGENGRARVPGGSGLGLHIARWIVEKHGGTIELDSHEGKGTRVDIYLPLQG